MYKFVFTPFLLGMLCVAVTAADVNARSVFIFAVANDGVVIDDNDFTHGISLGYYLDIDEISWLASPLEAIAMARDSRQYKLGFQLSQMMWSPLDISKEYPEPDERPYAGIIALETELALMGHKNADKLSLFMGVIGPSSYMEETQKFMHEIIKSPTPDGWDNQVENQALLNINYEKQHVLYRQMEPTSAGIELSHSMRLMAGNYRSEVATGLIARWGEDLENSFASSTINRQDPVNAGLITGENAGYYFFGGIDGLYRFNDITIDGDVPAEVYPVTVEPWQLTTALGVVYYRVNWGASLTFAVKTSEYKEDKNDMYTNGVLSLFYLW